MLWVLSCEGRKNRMDINLLPEEMLKNLALERKKKVLMILGLFLVMSILYFALFILDYYLQNEISYIDEQIESKGEVKNVMEEISAKTNEVNLIKEMIHERNESTINFYELMKGLEKLIPKGVTFTSQRSENGSMTIKGVADEEEEVAELAANLYELKGAGDIWIHSAAYEEQIRFEITFSYDLNGGGQVESK